MTRPLKKHYGNSAEYVVAVIAREAPDVLERMKKGEYRSVRQGAIDAGLISVPAPEDRALDALMTAWQKSDLETRQIFLSLFEEEIDLAETGRMPEGWAPRKKYECYRTLFDNDIPEIRYLAEKMSYSDIARKLGVPYRTLARWRDAYMGGKAISPAAQEKISRLAEAEGYRATQASQA